MGVGVSKSVYKKILTISVGFEEERTLLRNGEGKYIWKAEGKVPMETPVTVKKRPFDHGIVHSALVSKLFRPYAEQIQVIRKPSWVKTNKITEINEKTQWCCSTSFFTEYVFAFNSTIGRTIAIEPLELGLMPFRYEIGEVICFYQSFYGAPHEYVWQKENGQPLFHS